jgi:hypothetical protein
MRLRLLNEQFEMSHHGQDGFTPEQNSAMHEMLMKAAAHAQKKLQGEFPDGRLTLAGRPIISDEGAVAVVVGHEKGKVVMSFPHPTAWIGFTPNQAMDIAQSLITHAREAGIVGVYTIKL